MSNFLTSFADFANPLTFLIMPANINMFDNVTPPSAPAVTPKNFLILDVVLMNVTVIIVFTSCGKIQNMLN